MDYCPQCNKQFNQKNNKKCQLIQCKHIFCRNCLDLILKKPAPKCTICQKKFNARSITLLIEQSQVNQGQQSIDRLPQINILHNNKQQQLRPSTKMTGQVQTNWQKINKEEDEYKKPAIIKPKSIKGKRLQNNNLNTTSFIFQILIVIVFIWGNLAITSIYLTTFPFYFILAFCNILICQSYNLIKNKHIFTDALSTKHQLLNIILKQIIFFPLVQSSDDSNTLQYHIYFGIRWLVSVFSIVGMAQNHNLWNYLASLAVAWNLFSLLQPIISYYFLSQILRNLINKIDQIDLLQKIGMTLIIIYGITESSLQLYFVIINCPYYLILYGLCYVVVIISMIVIQQNLSHKIFKIIGLGIILQPFSLGSYFWMLQNRSKIVMYLIYFAMTIKHIVTPALMLGYTITQANSAVYYISLILSLFSPVQLTAGMLIQLKLSS